MTPLGTRDRVYTSRSPESHQNSHSGPGKLAEQLESRVQVCEAPIAWSALGRAHCKLQAQELMGFLRGGAATCSFCCPNESMPAPHAVYYYYLFLFAVKEGVGSQENFRPFR